MANDVIINGETYSGMDAVNLMKTDGTTETYYPDAVRYVPQNLTDEQKAQARANIGIEDADNVLVVTSENNVASHSSTEIIAAVDVGKAVFLFVGSVVYSLAGINADVPVFDSYVVIPNLGLLNHTRYSIGADKKITVTTDSTYVSRLVDSAIEELKENGELGSDSVLIVTATDTVASHSSTEIIAAVDAGKGVFFSKDSVVYPLAGITNGIPNFDVYVVSPKLGYLNHTRYSVDADKKITITTDSAFISNLVDAAIEELKANGELGVSNYEDLTNKPVIPSSVTAVEHQYAVANSKEQISDVVTWNVHASAQTKLSKRVRACIFANGYYVACGTNAELGYSTDGETWTVVAPFISTSLTLTNITYGKGKFVVLDQNGNLFAAEGTPDTWTKICDESYWPGGVGSLIYANNQFVAAGDYFAAFSEDCISWTIVEAPSTYNQIAFGNGRYVAVGGGGAVSVSYDGKTWTDCSNPDVTGDLRAVTYAQGHWFIGGINGTIMYTDDFVNWGIATSNSEGVRYVRAIVYMENKFYAACYNSSPARGEIWVSNDGMTWTVQHQQSSMLWCMSAKDGRLITAGDSGCVCILDLGIEWLRKQPELASGQHLWERIVFILSDGGETVSDGICIKSAPNTENWVFTLEDGSTVTKAVNVG